MRSRALELAIAVICVSGCKREDRDFQPVAPAAVQAASGAGPYDANAFGLSEGKRLFRWYNCSGCHSNGGGGMGPALMDDEWIYGVDAQSIHDSIAHGRPNGMPAFGTRVGDDQIWQLVAYVRSLSGQVPKDVTSARGDQLRVTPVPTTAEPAQPKAAPH